VRIAATLLTVSAIVASAACSGSDQRRDTALSSELQRDLQLATTSVALPESPTANDFALETAPLSAPAPATTIRRAPGRKAVRSHEHTVAAAPEQTLAESVEQVAAVTETPAVSETPADAPPTSVGVALPRPTAIPVSLPADEGRGVFIGDDAGRGSGGGMGGTIGVVIRGGGVGDDHCELHDRRRRGGRPVYRPMAGGIAGGRRPMIGQGTFPVNY
jgi:hypothetical protein